MAHRIVYPIWPGLVQYARVTQVRLDTIRIRRVLALVVRVEI